MENRQGYKKMKTEKGFVYEWVNIPEGFDAWNQALVWNWVKEDWLVISREEMRMRKEKERKELERTQKYFEEIQNIIGEERTIEDVFRSPKFRG
jgi:hypothetical protein